jgi:hypothetical protein
VQSHAGDVDALRTQVRDLGQQVKVLAATNAQITGRLRATDQKLLEKDAGIAPLAARVLRSVFRVETSSGWFGTGFAAWTSRGHTYVLTANHVVAHASGGTVTLDRTNGSWTGDIAANDPKNDLAVIEIEGQPAGAAPLWQTPASAKPRPGDQLLLAGSPYGLDGTVTTGIVSRVTATVIQTDAAPPTPVTPAAPPSTGKDTSSASSSPAAAKTSTSPSPSDPPATSSAPAPPKCQRRARVGAEPGGCAVAIGQSANPWIDRLRVPRGLAGGRLERWAESRFGLPDTSSRL